MLQKIFPVVLKKFPPELETQYSLQVGLEKNILQAYGIAGNSSKKEISLFIGALIRDYPILHEPISCTFIQICILEPLEQYQDPEIIPLYVTNYFIEHYDYNYNDICYLKSVLSFPLEKILFGAKSAESFNWFQDPEKFSTLVQYVGENNILCRQGDIPLTTFYKTSGIDIFNFTDLITLDCQPFRQGLLNLKSSVILADVRDELNFSENLTNKKADISNSKFLLKLISYTSNNILGIHLHTPSISSLSAPMRALVPPSFEVRIIPKLGSDFLKELNNLSDTIDPMNTIFLPFNSSKIRNINNGSWVKIKISDSPENKSKSSLTYSTYDKVNLKFGDKHERVAQVCILSNKKLISKYFQSDNIVYITPSLWFNLNEHPSPLVQPDARLIIETMKPGYEPPYATEAFVCLIQSPHYDGKINSDYLIKKYFSIPRFVRKDDVFSLNSKYQFDFHTQIQDEEVDRLKWPVVHYRITGIDGPSTPYGYLLYSKNSRLYQSGTKHSYAPITMETYYQLSSYHPIWNAVPTGFSQYIDELQNLILPFLKLKNRGQLNCNILFTGPACCGKKTVIKAVCRCLNLHLYQINCHEFGGETTASIESRLRTKISKGSAYAPCIILLKNIHCIGKEKDPLNEDSRVTNTLANLLVEMNSHRNEMPILVIGTAIDQKHLSNNLVSVFLQSVHMVAPNEEERCLILEDLLTVCDVGNDVSVRYLAQRTAGFVLGDLCALVNQGIKNAYHRMDKMVKDKFLDAKAEEDIILASVPIVQRDLLNALEKLQSEFADAIGAPRIPNVKFEDVGGLSDIKKEILDTIQLPLEHPEILSSGLRRSGVLLYGPPGSGKTLLAKAVATECSLNFLSVKGPELINMYIGQSEENVRAVFSQARSAVPCIIFFDELDSLAPNRGRSGDSGGVMDRVVSQLLAELDGLNKKSEVFVIGATNRPDLLDPALLRPGRFDRLLYVGIPEDEISKLSILRALTRKIPLAPDVNLKEIVNKCSSHLSGADFYSLCSNAVIQRMEKNIEMLEKGEKYIEELDCDVTTEDFLCALETVVPSVSPEQYKQYQVIKSKIEQE